MGDFNIAIAGCEKTNEKMMSAGLINLFENRLATSSLPRTHKLGKNAIDHI